MENFSRTFSQEWRVETLRMTGFPKEVIKEPEHYQWWFALTGESPENRTQNPRKATLHEEGPFKNGKLILEVQPIRLDLLRTAHISELVESTGIPTLDLFSNIIGDFEQLTTKLFNLEPFPPLQRIALGAILVNPVKDRKEGYKKLADFLRFPIDADNSSDLFYQINRPRLFDLPSEKIAINRLSKWSVAGYEMLALQVMPELRSFSSSSPLHAIRLEVDISTTQHFAGSFNKEALPVLFKELIDYAIEISEKGDIP